MANSLIYIDIKPGDRVLIGGELVTIELLKKSGQLAHLRVSVPSHVPVKKELFDRCAVVARMTG